MKNDWLKRTVALLMPVIAGVFTSAERPANALTTIYAPWGTGVTSEVKALYGKDHNGSGAFIVWQNRFTGECTSQNLGTGNGLFDDYQVVLTDGNDEFWTLAPGQATVQFCGMAWDSVNFGFHFLDVSGGYGNDLISSGSAGNDSWIGGSQGDDFLWNNHSGSGIVAYDGNDTLATTGNSMQMWGGDGNDCLEDSLKTATTFDCGNGSDKYAYTHAPSTKTSCESSTFPAYFCPYPGTWANWQM